MFRFLGLLPVFLCSFLHAQNNCTQFVNPIIGTGGHGHTFPGATRPFAMVQLSPDTRIDGSWDGCSGYHYSDSIIYGFSHTHLSGTGCSDYGDIAFMPTWVSKPVEPIDRIDTLSAYFSHKTEVAKAGYYSVELNNGTIKVELTSTTRVGLQRYTYKRSGYTWITLNLKHRDELLEGKITQLNRHSFSGLRRSKAWAQDQLLYYYFELSRDAEKVILSKGAQGETKVNLGFWVKAGESILVKTALSSVDEAGAKANMVAELDHWNFQKVMRGADAAWNLELNRIRVYGGKQEEKVNFYTALYHCMMHPNVMNDVDGRYMGRDRKVHKAEGFDYYTVFSLWDTHRALHPLLNIIDKKRSHDFIMTFKAQYEQSGRLPMWELWGNETNCMIGFHSVSVILDAYVKGVITKEELRDMYPAVKAEAMSDRFGLDKFREKGYLEVEDESESVSKTLEYSYDMWCVSEIAKNINSLKDVPYFGDLSDGHLSISDVFSGFVRPRKNGGWLEPFDPREVNNHYTEANAWQYNFYKSVMRKGLLDSMFTIDSRITGRNQVDVTGLIGQYAHGNEPSHSFIYKLEKSKREFYLYKVMNEFYRNNPEGLCGNDDCGQMSAWYVFSAMGFYPVLPGYSQYKKGISLFDSIYFENKQAISNQVKENIIFTTRAGEYMTIHHSAPVIYAIKNVFEDSLLIKIELNYLNEYKQDYYVIFYSINNSEPTRYSEPFYIHNNSSIKAFIKLKDKNGKVLSEKHIYSTNPAYAHFYKRPNNYSIQIKSTYNKQYTADGDEGLIDGLTGDTDWRKGRWQGYQGQHFEAVIDLQKLSPVHRISAGFLQDTRAWILFPSNVHIEGSADGIHYQQIGSVYNLVADSSMKVERVEFTRDKIDGNFRYIRIRAINYGKLPPWHPGRGEDAFIFVDEITINE